MPPLPTYGKRPVVLLTNDDGPPCDHSPNIYAFAKRLMSELGWEVRVCIPDGQRSWVGKGFAINQIIKATFFYPLEPDGRRGEITTIRRPLREGESMEWVLLDGTPATCSNIGLQNIYPGEIDMVISGPNHGRNSSAAFALASGTIGAAMAGALAVPIPGPPGRDSLHTHTMPCIAMSYGMVKRPVEETTVQLAHEIAVDVCKRLFDDWGYEEDDKTRPVQVYSVNIPLVPEALTKEMRRVCFTTMWRNAYGRLFNPTDKRDDTAGWVPGDDANIASDSNCGTDDQLRFVFAPNFQHLLHPDPESVPEGTDAWAFYHGYTSVTPLRAQFGELEDSGWFGKAQEDRFW